MKVKPVTAAGGVVYRLRYSGDEPEVLLIYRRGFWDLPKGKLDDGESVPMCAVREVAEETGSDLPVIISDLCSTYHEYEEKGEKWGKTTWWYAMVLPSRQKFVPERNEGIEEVKWVALSEAEEKVGFDNLRKVLKSFREYIS